MSYTQTTNLNLYKEDSNESIRSLRVHNNENVDILDTQIQALKDVIVNAKALLGQLGVDANGDPLIDINTARGVLNAAADGTSGEETLYSVNQQAAQNAVDIASLQNSVYFEKWDALCPYAVYKGTGTTINLSKSLRDYKYIAVISGSSYIKAGLKYTYFPIVHVNIGSSDKFEIFHTISGALKVLYIQFTSATQVKIDEATDEGAMIRQIYGIA